MQKYVCVRIVSLKGIDVGLFDFDRHNAIYYFIMNADEEIYMRYGGRDSKSATTYLNLRSLEAALEKGIELHGDKDWSPTDPRPKKLLPRAIPMLADRTIKRNACVECHLIADYQTIELERTGNLNRIQDLFVSPDIKKLGLHLDIPQGLVIKTVSGPAESARIKSGDLITHLNGKPIYTFGDLQFRLGKVNRSSESIQLSVMRMESRKNVTINLPKYWWFAETGYRYWTVEPQLSFVSHPLSNEEKRIRSLPENSFASRIADMYEFDDTTKPRLQNGDIVLAVNGCQTDEFAKNVDMHIKLRYSSGTKMKLLVERDGKKFLSSLFTPRQSFRKPSIAAAKLLDRGSTQRNEVSFEAKRIGDFLVVWVNHSAGWHTYAMDNEIRAGQAAGKKELLGVEQGLSISLSGGLKKRTGWRQSKPKVFSDLGQKWFSFGFDEKACFACKVESIGTFDAKIHITGQTCDSKTCRPIDIHLRIPNVQVSSDEFDFDSLVQVQLKK